MDQKAPIHSNWHRTSFHTNKQLKSNCLKCTSHDYRITAGGGGGGRLARPLCTAVAFLILCLSTEVPTVLRDNCPFPPPTMPPPPWQSSPFTSRSVPPPNQLRQLKLPAWGRGYDQCKQSTHYLHHKNRVDFPQYTPSFPIPSALIHGDLWGSFIVLDRGDLELLEHIGKSLS